MAKRKYAKTMTRGNERLRTVPDLAGYASSAGMPAIHKGTSFRVEIRAGKVYQVVEQRYMLR